ncbi:MAG: tetratricopeptide repeat protein [Muribaculaceae bacterium]|nr:tetratricopeptide repeat protein [Muribaculaceae bacterium]
MNKLYRYIPIIILVATAVFSACSTKKNTAGTRFWQAMNTRYNVYYNGAKHYDEQIKVLENDYQDDYSTQLFIHPAEAYNDPKATQPTTNFDRTIEKMQKAISLHSIKKKPTRKAGKGNDPKYKEWLKREEYNPFLHNAWYLMAKAQYMKGDFTSSAATFHYISRHFSWKPNLVLEAQIWEALSYCALNWTTEADNVLAHIHPNQIEDSRLQQLANLAFADYYIKSKMNAEAVPYLEKAVKGAGGGQKVRLNFLLGQLYDETGQKEKAYEAYKRAGSGSNSTYRTKFNARIKQSAVFQGNDIDSEVKALKRMTRYDRNKEYLDQIYYAIGNLYLSRGDTVKAVENYELAAKKSTRNGIDKAISQLTLGGIYFAQHKYDKAQPCYSEAIPQLSETYPNYQELKHRSDVLDELAVYSGNVTLQDSLLRLSQLPLEEQKKVIAKIIEDLKKKEKEEKEAADREAYMAQQQGQGTGLKNNTQQPASYNINNDNSWYFYNTATKNAGKTVFQQQWGNRKLEDNWRRRNKNTFSLDENNDDEDQTEASDSAKVDDNDSTKVDKEAAKRAEDPHYEEYYLKQIPKTEEEIQTSNDVIQEGLYNMGVILKDKLEDLPAAAYEFEQLLERYPDNTYRLDTYYNMYLLYYRSGQYSDAERYRQLILSDFADSKYGQAMQDPNYLENLKRMNLVQEELYDQAYTAYLNNDNATVHAAYAEMMRTYPLSKIMPKFMFLHALAYVTERNPQMFKSTIKEMLERYPQTDITPTASAMLKQINQGRKINGGSSNTRGMIWSMRLSNDTTAGGEKNEFTPFKEGRSKPQYFVLVFSTDSVSSNQLLYEVAKHNFNSFLLKDFELEPMTFGNMGLIVVKGFANYPEVDHYRGVWEKDEEKAVPGQAHYVIISEENFNLLLQEGRTFEEYFRYLDELNEEQVEGQIPEDAQDDEEHDGDVDTDKPGKSVKKGQGKETEKTGDEETTVKPQANTPELQGDPQLLEEARRRAELRQLEEQRKAEEKRKQEEAKKQEEERKRQERIQQEEERRRQEEAEMQQATGKTQGTAVTQDADKPQVVDGSKTDQNNSQDDVRHLKKQKDEDTKARERSEKEAKKAEKERQKQLEREEKARQDSIKKAEKQREKELKAAEKAKEDSIKAEEKKREELEKQREKEKEEAAKRAEQERKDKAKAKEEARKQREQERKQRAKEREQKKKEEEKRKKEEAKARKEAAKQKQKEREEARKQRERERKEAEKNKGK